MDIQNKPLLSLLFPLSLSSLMTANANHGNPHGLQCCSRPHSLFANAIYHLRSNEANWIVSVQESKPGKLLLRDALTYEPIPYSSGCRHDVSGWSLTRLSIFHSFSPQIPQTKVVFDDSVEPMAVFKYYYGMCALRRCLSTDAGQLVSLPGALNDVSDFVNFNGCVYVVDARSVVYVVDRTRLQLLPLTCVNLANLRCPPCFGKRFVVSDGDLYLLFSFCIRLISHEILIFKLVMDDINNATCYRMEKVKDLGDRAFFVNKDCSFSVSARDLPPPLVGNCILFSKFAFPGCYCFSSFQVYFVGVKPAKMVGGQYFTLFKSPLLWNHQLERPPRKRKGRGRRSYNVPAEKL